MSYPGGEEDELNHDEVVHDGEYVEHVHEDEYVEEEQLVLAEEDDDLPWLEADEYEEDSGFDWSLIRFAAMAVVALAVLLGLIWWLTRDRPDPALVADGSTIEAPDGPYKERPSDPGGAEVAGTGDQAFAVAEGESTRGRIGEGEARPGIDREQASTSPAAGASPTATPSASASADSAGAAYVQIGAFASRADAQAAWSTATQRYSALSGMRNRIVEAEVNGATVYRLQAIAGSRDAGEATCRAIRNAGGDCYLR